MRESNMTYMLQKFYILVQFFFLQLRIVCVSDTHSLTNHIKFKIPDGDVLIHAGDVSQCGRVEEIIDFNDWLGNK